MAEHSRIMGGKYKKLHTKGYKNMAEQGETVESDQIRSCPGFTCLGVKKNQQQALSQKFLNFAIATK